MRYANSRIHRQKQGKKCIIYIIRKGGGENEKKRKKGLRLIYGCDIIMVRQGLKGL